jgi:hypothetical protein
VNKGYERGAVARILSSERLNDQAVARTRKIKTAFLHSLDGSWGVPTAIYDEWSGSEGPLGPAW